MKIFISLKVPRGDDELTQLADLTSDLVCHAGHVPFVAPYEISNQGLTDPKEFMSFARQQAANSDLMILLYHPELRGGLIELGLAYARGIPIWLCYPFGQRVSSSALGCAELTIEYVDIESLQKQLFANLRQFSQI